MKRLFAILASCAAISAAANAADQAAIPEIGPDQLSFSVTNMDRGVDPGVDFYRYASGGWLDRVERPELSADNHSPGNYRAFAALQHVNAFYEAFDIKEGDPMWLAPERRVNAW